MCTDCPVFISLALWFSSRGRTHSHKSSTYIVHFHLHTKSYLHMKVHGTCCVHIGTFSVDFARWWKTFVKVIVMNCGSLTQSKDYNNSVNISTYFQPILRFHKKYFSPLLFCYLIPMPIINVTLIHYANNTNNCNNI